MLKTLNNPSLELVEVIKNLNIFHTDGLFDILFNHSGIYIFNILLLTIKNPLRK